MYISKESFKINNLNIIQFMMSLFVIYSHAFSLGAGTAQGEVIKWLTSERLSAGSLAVSVLFIVSGYLVSASYDNSKSAIQYLKNRIFRIFPGLVAVVILTALVLGPCITVLSTEEYYKHPATWQYLKNIKLYPIHWNLPGVFEHNIYPKSVNGALWTLPYQFAFYIMVGVLGFLGLLRHKTVSLSCFVAFSYAHLMHLGGGKLAELTGVLGLNWNQFLYLGMYFSAGMTAYSFRDKLYLSKAGTMASIILLLFSWFVAKEFYLSSCVFGTYIILYLAYCTKVVNFPLFGLSFGIYIYSFPIQQTVTFLFGGIMNPYLNMLISMPIALLFAWLSNKCVERPAMNIKKYISIKNLIPDSVFTVYEKLYTGWMTLVDRIFAMSWIAFAILVIGAVVMVFVKNGF